MSEQLDMLGGSIPLEELELRGHSAAIAAEEREQGQKLTADEAGALLHERRGKHPRDQRCHFCSQDGTAALITLNTFRHKIEERRQAATRPGWACEDCGRANPGDATFCRGCASLVDQDREPHVPDRAHDPSTAEIPF